MPPSIKRPKKIKIGYANYTVVEDDERLKENAAGGMHAPNSSRIYVETEQENDYAKMALLHEVLHGCAHVSSVPTDDTQEELFVAIISPNLLQALRDNPQLVAYLLQKS
jgi:hypothetical protein